MTDVSPTPSSVQYDGNAFHIDVPVVYAISGTSTTLSTVDVAWFHYPSGYAGIDLRTPDWLGTGQPIQIVLGFPTPGYTGTATSPTLELLDADVYGGLYYYGSPASVISLINAHYTAATYNCSLQSDLTVTECEALVAFYDSTDGHNWTNNTGWLQTNTPCSWYGVTCFGGQVIGISLASNSLSGPIPAELADLSSLFSLFLCSNQLTGPIPPELGTLSRLRILSLCFNQLSGSIPPGLGGLSALQVLVLNNNQLVGEIPPELGNLADIYNLGLASNQLTGPIPAELGNLVNMQGNLALGDNDLTGPIPSELGKLAKLTDLDLQFNHLSGSIPAPLGNLTSLNSLWLDHNELSGPIPSELGNLAALTRLWLQGNDLTGTVPVRVAQLGASIQVTYGTDRCLFVPPGNQSLYMPATTNYQALGDPICGIVLTPLENLATDVASQIASLVDSGELVSGLGNALTNQFEKALEKLDAGKTAPATNMLEDLIDQIRDLITDGRISAAEGENLILLATALLP